MNDLFTQARIEAPEQRDDNGTRLPPVDIRCSVCASPNYFRVQPGQLATASTAWYRNPPEPLPGAVEVPSVAFCLRCDPVFAGRSARVPDGEIEFLSWSAAA